MGLNHPSASDETHPKARLGKRPDAFDPLFDADFYLSQLESEVPHDPKSDYLEKGYQRGRSPHPLFAPDWYLAQRGNVEHEDPFVDYLTCGTKLGLDPHPLFQTDFYCRQAGIDPTRINPLLHYSQVGWLQGYTTHPWIDKEYSVSQIPRRLVGRSSPLVYMLKSGLRKNLRFHPLFNPSRLAIAIRQQGREINCFTLSEAFVAWALPFSPSPLLDFDFYCQQHPELARSQVWRHFMDEGQYRAVDPNPYFDSTFYLEQYRKYVARDRSPFLHYMTNELKSRFDPSPNFRLRHYLKRNPTPRISGESPLETFLESGRYRSVETTPFVIPAFVMQHAKQASRYEPTILKSSKALAKLPVYNRHMSSLTATEYDMIKSVVSHDFKALVLVPQLGCGGADLAVHNLVRYLGERYGLENVLLVATDAQCVAQDEWLAKGTRLLVLSHFDPLMSSNDRELFVQYLIEDFRPERCYNVNSDAAWNLFASKGKPLSSVTHLYALLSCFDYDESGLPIGHAMGSLPKALPYLKAAYTDNARFCRVLRDVYNLTVPSGEKLKVLYQPARSGDPRHIHETQALSEDDLGERRAQIAWAGRPGRQNRLDIMIEVARRCPRHDFHLFGLDLSSTNPFSELDVPENVKLRGQFHGFLDGGIHHADLFLYTSAWDGLPSILIDAVGSGIPVVAPDVGGIAELIDDSTGWLVPNVDDASAFVEAIEQIIADPNECELRTNAARQRLQEQHGWDHYAKVLQDDFESDPARPETTLRAELMR